MAHQKIIEFTKKLWRLSDSIATDKLIDEIVHQDVIIDSTMGQSSGIVAFKEMINTVKGAFDNPKVEWKKFIIEANDMAIFWESTGVHTRPFQDISATNRVVAYSGTTRYQIENGKIIYYWAMADIHAIRHQLLSE